ncbi:prepilin peptidase [Clostridium sp.]|uniref:Prepilin peptidase n=1 Tax=Clostridium porci TaxID=2605778 RepID=A0A7X2NJW4_9CLOT|nr:prepilin peptidase [Clostridium porci]
MAREPWQCLKDRSRRASLSSLTSPSPNSQHEISPYQLIPVLSFLTLRIQLIFRLPYSFHPS